MTEKKTLAFMLLAGLLREPRSGYDLTRWMVEEAGHFFAIGHSSIYPALGRLERGGMVRHEVVPSEKGPDRKVYSLTEAGREALLGWADEPAAEREVRDEQVVKALCYGYLPTDQALARLKEVKTSHIRKLELYEGFERELKEQFRAGALSREAYLGILLTIRRGVGAERSYVAWCDEAAQLTTSTANSLAP